MNNIFKLTFIIFLSSMFQVLNAVDCYNTKSESCVEKPAYGLPKTVDEFLSLREKIGKEPYGGATLFVFALIIRTFNPDLGNQLLVLSTSEEKLKKSNSPLGYKGYAMNDSFLMGQADKVPHCLRSYASTTKTEDNYNLDPAQPVALRFRLQEKYVGTVESGLYKVFVCSTGADSCRPVSLKQNSKGYWKVTEFSSLVTGCKVPRDKSINKAEEDL